MAQLTADDSAFDGKLIPVDDAVALVADRITPIAESEMILLAQADGRVLAEPIFAALPLPPFDNSAVDGYAVRQADVLAAPDHVFPVTARLQAGDAASHAVAESEALRIFTGAPMPCGADTVYMQEDVQVLGNGVRLPAGLARGANVRLAGEDISRGQIALPRGRRLRPQDVALMAALGLTHAVVCRPVRVAVFSTGDEIAAPGADRGPAQTYDSNRTMLTAMLRRLGCRCTDLGILRDDVGALADALKAAAREHDLIVTSGGVSTGEEDHVKAAVEEVGALVMWRVAIKPGRPVAMGTIDGTPLIGLPGNPVASFVTFRYLVRPAVLALLGAEGDRFIPSRVRATFQYRKKAGRREYVRVSVRRGAGGVMEAQKFPREGAGLLSSLVETDGLVELPEAITKVAPGDDVDFLPYAALL